jgi:DNA-binding MarR family transcriptional regulator
MKFLTWSNLTDISLGAILILMRREEVIEAIFATMQQMHRTGASKFQLLMGWQEISLSQMELLLTVKHMQPVSAKTIAAHMRLTPGAVTQLMESLEAKQYIERRPSESDRRATNVYLADSGKQKLKALWERRKAMMHKIMETLDDEELGVMLRVQQKMLEHMEDCAAAAKQEQ